MKLSIPDPNQQIDLSGVNLFDPHFYADGDPHAVWAYLRKNAPVYKQTLADGRSFWVVTKHEDVCKVLKDHTLFTSQKGTMLCILGTPDIAGGKMMAATDPPRHTQMRKPIGLALSMEALQVHEPKLREIVNKFLDSGLEEEEWDFSAAALMFPMAFTGTLMGLPQSDWTYLARLTTMSIANEDPEFMEGTPQATLKQAHQELFGYFAMEIAQRRAYGKESDDLINVLMTMDAGGKKMTDEEIIFNCYSLLLGANVTTPHAAGATVLAMAENPDEYRRWTEHPELLESGVEEGLRWASPANHFMRYAVKDIEMHGVQIRQGDAVTAWLGSANRDDEVFKDPFRFDISRKPNRHVAFGYGPHFCVGAPLARFALRILFAEMLRRVERIELAGPIEHLVSNFVAGIKHMPVRMTLRKEHEVMIGV